MWTLILLVYQQNLSGLTINVVPGFLSENRCFEAGAKRQSAMQQDDSRGQYKFVCMKRITTGA